MRRQAHRALEASDSNLQSSNRSLSAEGDAINKQLQHTMTRIMATVLIPSPKL